MNMRFYCIAEASIKSMLEISMRIIVQVTPQVARAIHRGKPIKEVCPEVSAVAERLSTSIKPLHPGDADETAASYFTLEVPDRATADQIVERLKSCRDVRAAFWKPRAAAP